MPRTPRTVIPGMPHHVTQRGNRRQPVFFSEGDYRLYRHILAEQCRLAEVRVWAYCLMPNHVHLVLVPAASAGLTAAVGETHRRYTTAINKREGFTGYLWQGRYGSEVVADGGILEVVRYVERNPVAAGLGVRPEDWPWSSANAHLGGVPDPLLDDAPLVAMVADWRALLE
jgi:putative transposase